MPASSSGASEQPAATAPDGIAIHTFSIPPAALVGIAEGRIPHGRYAVHRHLTIEQYTYVLTGEVTAFTGNGAEPEGRPITLGAGDLLLTLPGETLEFRNDSDTPARVLFICAPPYPPDDSDTRTLDSHRSLAEDEARASVLRLRALRSQLDALIEARIAALDPLAGDTDSKRS